MNHTKLNNLIDSLDNAASGARPFDADWKSIWKQIKEIGGSFKETRYPSKDEKQKAWDRFQSIVQDVKSVQADERREWQNRENNSKEILNRILNCAYSARPPSGLERAIGAIVLAIPDAIATAVTSWMPGEEIDEWKESLKQCSASLREGWDLLSDNKQVLLGKHKKEAFDKLKSSQDDLDYAWEQWRDAQQKAWEARQAAFKAKREDFRDRVHDNIENLKSRVNKLYGVLAHKERHLDDLRDKRDSAWSDDYRYRVDGWIDEEEDSISDIKNKIDQIEGWIDEERDKLR